MNPWCSNRHVILISAVLVLLADFFIGPYVTFPIIFILPLGAMAWWHTYRSANILAAVMVTIRFINTIHWNPAIPNLVIYALINSVVRLSVFLILIYLITHVAEQQRSLKREVKVLEGLLPICAHCKQIRTSEGEWEQLEEYITRQSEATFSHSICPSCRQKYFGRRALERLKTETLTKLS